MVYFSLRVNVNEIGFRKSQKVPVVDEEDSVDSTDTPILERTFSMSLVWIFSRQHASFGPHHILLNRRILGIKGQKIK